MEKICPLMCIGNVHPGPRIQEDVVLCQGEKCAFWIDQGHIQGTPFGRCSIVQIANALEAMATK